ncbi:MAG: ribosome maturation factor RimM, partial [Pseudomonadota bacterium]
MARETPQSQSRVLLGQIGRAHGVRGDVLVRSFCEPPDEIARLGELTDETGNRVFNLRIKGRTSKGLICRVDGIEDRTAAEGVRNTELYVARDRLPLLPEDEVYLDDLVGMTAVNADDSEIGRVIGVHNFGAGDLLEVKLPGSSRTEFLPFESRFIADIDAEAGVIRFAIDDGDDDDHDTHTYYSTTKQRAHAHLSITLPLCRHIGQRFRP